MKHSIFTLCLLLMLSRQSFAQELTYKKDSVILRISRPVEMEDGSTDTVSCSRYHHFVWFDETSATAKRLNHELYGNYEKPVESASELKKVLTDDFNDWAEEWNAQFTAEDSAPINYSFNLSWYEESSIGISHQTQTILCTFQALDGYYGGTHPMGGIAYQVYELPDAKRVQKWQNLFTDTTAILKMAEEIFRKEKSLAPKVSLEEAGYWFNNNRFHLTDNFGLDAEGIFFVFNQYEVASYAEGPIDISIPYARIRKYLKKPL